MSTTNLRPPFARNIRHLLAERRMTQQELAIRLHVATRTVAGWCAGTSTPHRRRIEQLAVMFGRGPQWFKDEHGHGLEDE